MLISYKKLKQEYQKKYPVGKRFQHGDVKGTVVSHSKYYFTINTGKYLTCFCYNTLMYDERMEAIRKIQRERLKKYGHQN